jgi:hypothetical protein
VVAQGEVLEDFRGNSFHRQAGALLETETAIVGWVANQDATFSAHLTDNLQALGDQGFANAALLERRRDGDGTERQPLAVFAANLDRRKRNVADYLSVSFGDQPKSQGSGGPEAFDNQVFRLVAEGVVCKRSNQDVSDGFVIGSGFGADEHGLLQDNHQRVDDGREPEQEAEDDVDQQLPAGSDFQEDSERRKQNGDNHHQKLVCIHGFDPLAVRENNASIISL